MIRSIPTTASRAQELAARIHANRQVAVPGYAAQSTAWGIDRHPTDPDRAAVRLPDTDDIHGLTPAEVAEAVDSLPPDWAPVDTPSEAI